jgi:hypothetical protein
MTKELTTKDKQVIIVGLTLYKKEIKSIMTKTENLQLVKELNEAKKTFLGVEEIVLKLTEDE